MSSNNITVRQWLLTADDTDNADKTNFFISPYRRHQRHLRLDLLGGAKLRFKFGCSDK